MKRLKEILDDISQIHEVYRMDTRDPSHRPIYTSDMCRAVQGYYGNGLEINIKEIPASANSSSIIGVYRKVGKKIDIFHAATAKDGSPNYCYKRFIVAKELCHLK